MVIVAYHAGWLYLVNEVIQFTHLPIKGILVMIPIAVKPYRADGTVVRQQLTQLGFHEIHVGIVIFMSFPATGLEARAAEWVIFAYPVELRII